MPEMNVFLSYRTDDAAFAKQVGAAYLGSHDRQITIFDWRSDGRIKPGERLSEALREKIATADVFIAFVNKGYFEAKAFTQEEMLYALNLQNRRGGGDPKKGLPRIVPFVLSDGGKRAIDTWDAPVADHLRALALENSFVPGEGKRYPEDDNQFRDFITELRDEHLAELMKSTVADQPDAGVAPSQRSDGVVLLDPITRADDEEQEQDVRARLAAAKVMELLGGIRTVIQVPSKWVGETPISLQDAAGRNLVTPLFVQVLSARKVDTVLETPTILASRLSQRTPDGLVGRSRLAYWLPADQVERGTFDKHCERQLDGEPTLRSDEPKGLAEWLRPLLADPACKDAPGSIAAYQLYDSSLGMKLMEEFESFVTCSEDLLNFRPDDFPSLLKRIARDRPIVIAHNFQTRSCGAPSQALAETKGHFARLTQNADAVLEGLGVATGQAFWLAVLRGGHKAYASARLWTPQLHRWNILEASGDDGDCFLETGPRRDWVTQEIGRWKEGATGD